MASGATTKERPPVTIGTTQSRHRRVFTGAGSEHTEDKHDPIRGIDHERVAKAGRGVTSGNERKEKVSSFFRRGASRGGDRRAWRRPFKEELRRQEQPATSGAASV